MNVVRRFADMPYLAPEKGEGGASAEDQYDDDDLTGADDGASGADDDGDAGGAHAAGREGRSADDGDDDDDALLADGEDDDADDRPIEDRYKAVRAALRKSKRRLIKSLAFTRVAKDHGLTPKQLVDVIGKARNFDALAESVGGDLDRLTRALARATDEDDDGKGRAPAKRTTASDEDEEFDETKLPWSRDDANGKYLAKMARQLFESGKTLKQAIARVAALEGGIVQDRTSRTQQVWVQARDAAARKIADPDTRDVFNNLVAAGYERAMRNPQDRTTPQQVIDWCLKKLKVNPTTARIASGAAQQRIAESNAQRPRGQVGGTPAGAKPRPKEKTVAEVSKRLRMSVGA